MAPLRDANVSRAPEDNQPTVLQVLLMLAAMFAIHLFIICKAGNFWAVIAPWFDNAHYVTIATIIRTGHLSAGEFPWHFWGFPFAIVGISTLLSIPALWALVMISVLGSLAACVLVHRLYGGWVAAAFIFINYQWLLLSVEGGSEPLFMCLLYASFLASRSDRWNLAALLASLSTTVRPVGVFALMSFAAVLVMQRKYRQLAVITLIGLGIGALYVIPVWIILGNPFANFVAYQQDLKSLGQPLTYPFGAFKFSFMETLHSGATWYHLAYFVVWVAGVVVGIVAMWSPSNRKRFSGAWMPEALFASIYSLFFLTYNYIGIATHFTRFLLPVVPMLVFSLREWIPHDRRVLWMAAMLTAVVASVGRVGFQNVFRFGFH